MNRRNSLFSLSRSGSGDREGVEIATEMAPGEPLCLSPLLITEHVIMSEYALICRDPIDGLYVVPSARDKFEWFGLLFIRRGVYAGAVLRFTMNLPADFPSKELPRYFVDGWKPDRHHLCHALLIVQRTFFTFDSDPTSCVNVEAATLLRDNKEAYRIRASELIRKSRSVIYDPVTTDDTNAIRLTPWDASIHEPLRQRLIGGLTDSQISTMSMLGSLGCGLSNSSVFESRGKHGFSWISPSDMCYMVEPRRPADLDLKIISETEGCTLNAMPSNGSYTGESSGRNTEHGNIIPLITKLDLGGVDDQEQVIEKEETEENIALSMKEDDNTEYVTTNEIIIEPLERIYEEERNEESEMDRTIVASEQERSERSESEEMETIRSENAPITNAFRIRSISSSDEVGESDI